MSWIISHAISAVKSETPQADIRFVLPCLLGNDNTTRGTIHDIRNHTPDHPPTAARPEQLLPRDNGYACHEVAVEKLGKFTVRVWRHLHRDCDGTRFEFDATIDGLVDASSHCSNSC